MGYSNNNNESEYLKELKSSLPVTVREFVAEEIPKPKECFVIRSTGTSGTFRDGVTSDIIGVALTEEEAKSRMSVFCYYEKVPVL